MSRIGRKPILIPPGVHLTRQDGMVQVKGPQGELTLAIPERVGLEMESDRVQLVADYRNDPRAKALMGTTRAVMQNAVDGVAKGFSRKLLLSGVGYRASLSGEVLELSLGFTKPVRFPLPQGVKARVEGNNNEVVLTSHDKVILGQAAAKVRSFRPAEPFQGKGVLYEGEKIRRKAGKTGKK